MKSEDWIYRAKLTSEIWKDPSEYYSFLNKETNQIEAFKFVLRKLKSYKRNNLIVIDIGVGIAWTSILLSELDCVSKVIAVDIKRDLIDMSIEFYKNNKIGNTEKIHVTTGSFDNLNNIELMADVIICNASIHHSLNLDIDIENISNYLVSKGVLILSNELPISMMRYVYYSIRKILRFIILMYKDIRVNEYIGQGAIMYNHLGDNHITYNLYIYLLKKYNLTNLEIEKTKYYPYIGESSHRNIGKLVNFYAYKI